MTSQKTATVTVSRPACKYPGCEQPAAPAEGPGRPPEYCSGRGHTRVSAWRERRRLAAEKAGTAISPAGDTNPVTMARVTGAELLRSLRAEADRITALGTDLRDRIDVLADPTAAEAEVEAVRAAAEQRAQAAETDRDATVAKVRADAEARTTAAGTEREAAIAQARTDADGRVRAAEADRAEAARERDELRADLRARAERAEQRGRRLPQ